MFEGQIWKMFLIHMFSFWQADEAEDSQQELDKLQMQHSLLQKIVEQQQQVSYMWYMR